MEHLHGPQIHDWLKEGKPVFPVHSSSGSFMKLWASHPQSFEAMEFGLGLRSTGSKCLLFQSSERHREGVHHLMFVLSWVTYTEIKKFFFLLLIIAGF